MAFLGLIPDFEGDVQLRLSPEEARKEAIGRALTLMGSVIGMVGGITILSVNPAFREKTREAWQEMPEEARQNKAATLIGVSLIAASVAYYGFRKRSERRYGAA